MKTALVTGGSRGIGAAVVSALSAAGYAVAFTYAQNGEAADAVAKKTGALAIEADSRVEEEVIAAVKTATDAMGEIDLLVNNAGVSSFSLLQDLSLDEWNRVFSVSVTGAFLYARAVLPAMIRKGTGNIVNISSMWGLVGASMEVHYSAAKAALIGFTKALAKEVGPSGVRVNAVAPGVIDTDMNRALDEATRRELSEETPLCRAGLPEEVAKAVLFLASEDSSFVTGDVLNVTGGLVV